MINEWENLSLQEKEAELSSIIDNDEFEMDDLLLDRTDNTAAKWDIRDIFVDGLEVPFFIEKNVV